MNESMEEPNKFEVPAELMTDFQNEISKMQKAEVGSSVHLEGVNIEDLTAEDFAMWQRVKHYPNLGKITPEELARYEDGITAGGNPSRMKFVGGLINNKITSIWGFEQLAEMEEESGL